MSVKFTQINKKLSFRNPFILFLGLGYFYSFSQAQDNVESNYSKLSAFDSNYIYKYESKLVIGPCLSYRNYNIALYPQVSFDSITIPSLKWRSPSNRFWGIDFSYDKFGFTFSFANIEPKSEQEKKGPSSSKSIGISYGGNRCFIETNLRSYKGFYEKNSLLRDSTLENYYQAPNLATYLFNLKLWYFTNHHKFAFKSCYGGLYRQVKTRASFVFSSNLHFSAISTDSSIVPDPDKQYYDNAISISSVGCAGISIFGGGAVNFVIKRGFFLNMAFVAGPDFQSLRTMTNTSPDPISRNYVNYAHDIKFATGFNLKYWYLTFTFSHEMNRFNNDLVKMRGRQNSLSFNLGFRLGLKKPRLYEKFQNTWLYRAF
jgi:hypothetical protein